MTSSMEYYINQDVTNKIVESFKANIDSPNLQALLTHYVTLLENCLRLAVDKMNDNPETVDTYKTEVKHHVDMFTYLIDKLDDLRCVYGHQTVNYIKLMLFVEELVLSRPKDESS